MAFSINDMKSRLRFGGARPNLFEVNMAFPTGIGRGGEFAYSCKAASIPGSTLGIIEVPYMGRMIKVAGNRSYEPWTATIRNDEDFAYHDLFMDWHNRINSPEGNVNGFGTSSPSAYKMDGSVTHFGQDGKAIKTYTWVGVIPTNVSPIELSWENNDQIEEFTVDFDYDYFVEGSSSFNLPL